MIVNVANLVYARNLYAMNFIYMYFLIFGEQAEMVLWWFTAFRMNLQQEKTPSGLVLYHFVGSETSVSADPVFMIRRLTSQVKMLWEKKKLLKIRLLLIEISMNK